MKITFGRVAGDGCGKTAGKSVSADVVFRSNKRAALVASPPRKLRRVNFMSGYYNILPGPSVSVSEPGAVAMGSTLKSEVKRTASTHSVAS